MLTEFCANTELHPNRIDLNWSWQDTDFVRPALHLVRRQRAYPTTDGDGYRVLDTGELVRSIETEADQPEVPWCVIERICFLMPNSSTDGGLLQAEVLFFFSKLLFTIDQSFTNELETSNTVTAALREQFQRFGEILSATAQIAVAESGREWTITSNPNRDNQRKYCIRKETVDAQFLYVFFIKDDDADALLLKRAHVRLYAGNTGDYQTTTIDNITRAPWTEGKSLLEIYATPGGDAEELSATLTLAPGTDNSSALLLWWVRGQAIIDIAFDHSEAISTVIDGDAMHVVSAQSELRAHFRMAQVNLPDARGALVQRAKAQVRTALDAKQQPAPAHDLVGEIWLDERFDPDSGEWRRQVTLHDMGLQPESDYYYALFAPDGQTGNYRTERTWRSAATTTRDYGLGERLYRLLPSIHQQYDEPAPGHNGAGQLRSFVEIFGAALDQVRSLDEDLASRHDVDQVRADLLPHLAHWIGWELDDTLGTLAQRDEIRFAPARYETLGTRPNLRDLVYHVTGRACKIKEFVQNVFLTNAPEPIPFWEIWSGVLKPDHAWSEPPKVLVRADGFDGQPVALQQRALPGSTTLTSWLYWCSDRSGRRTLWQQELGWPVLNQPQPMDIGSAEGIYHDEEPAAVTVEGRTWLFWSTNRDGNWEIYARLSDISGSRIERLTDHPADDLHPTATVDANGTVWLFWQSNRRGPTDIWAQIKKQAGSAWSLPMRITTAERRHETPAAVQYGNQLWLFWSDDQGDRRNIYYSVRATMPNAALNDGWSTPQPVTVGGHRDEVPMAIVWNEKLWLFWHSNRGGHWQIWGCRYETDKWGKPERIITDTTGNKEPVAVVEGENLRLFWRSQRRGRAQQSRSVDFRDSEMLAQLGTFEDRTHYTYDTRPFDVQEAAWETNRYARGAVGVHLLPATDQFFHLAWSYFQELSQATDLRWKFQRIFQIAGRSLSNNAKIVTTRPDRRWRITDGNQHYLAVRNGETLDVSRVLPDTLCTIEEETPDWKQIFFQLLQDEDAGVTLSATAKIKMEIAGSGWLIQDGEKSYRVRRYSELLNIYDLKAAASYSVDWTQFQKALKESNLTQAFRQTLQDAGLALSADVEIVAESAVLWLINDRGVTYLVIRQINTLAVYRPVLTIPWATVQAQLLRQALQTLFAEAGPVLSDMAKIVTDSVGSRWQIEDRDRRYLVVKRGELFSLFDRAALGPVIEQLQQLNDYIEPFRPAQMQYIWKVGDEID